MSVREDIAHQRVDRISGKRKLEDYGSSDEELSDLVCLRMKRHVLYAVNSSEEEYDMFGNNVKFEQSVVGTGISDARWASCSSSSNGEVGTSIQFFVKMISGGNTIVIHANLEDSVLSVHEKIRKITGIPIGDQRLIYRGKQLDYQQPLAVYSIEKDAGLQLVGRMRSTKFPRTWQIVNDIVSSISHLSKGDSLHYSSIVESRVKEFLKMTSRDHLQMAAGHLRIFNYSGAAAGLVMLFFSSIKRNKDCAEESIRLFLTPNIENNFPEFIRPQFTKVILEFCKLLSKDACEEPLYISCRSTLRSLLETIAIDHGPKCFDKANALCVIRDFFPFVSELARKLSRSLQLNLESPVCQGPSVSDVREFAAFLFPLRSAIDDHVGLEGPIPILFHGGIDKLRCYGDEVKSLYDIFIELLEKADLCFKKVEDSLDAKGTEEIEIQRQWWSQYLSILKELNNISKLYQGAEEKLCSVMRLRQFSLNTLIVRYARRSDDHGWLLEHKDVTNFESRRHLVMLMFPDVREGYDEMHEMLIDRSHMLAESFEYIFHADPQALHGGIFMEFKNEDATGPGVLREWFCLVCQAIFNPQNALFVACTNDCRRFFPNPASKVNPLNLDYFRFCGRVIALALMHKVQVGIVFDRVFFLQLAGKFVSLEDVRDADPFLYNSCKKILEMDADFMNSDGLGLTFVREIEEFGSRRIVELCPGGKSITVNSRNREEYVNLLIQHCFVTSIAEQVARFAQGFADILCSSKLQKSFFESMDLEDLDRMLHGSESPICVKDWKAHTEYNGYRETDQQIYWFWKIVEDMSVEQRRVLLFFWTSIKFLPVEGFGGLASQLYIFKTPESRDQCLPVSHTCFYQLCIPPYTSLDVMRDRLRIITGEHVSSSFGLW